MENHASHVTSVENPSQNTSQVVVPMEATSLITSQPTTTFDSNSSSTTPTTQIGLRKCTRVSKPPSHLSYYYCSLICQDNDDKEPAVNYAISNHLSHYNLSPNFKNLIMNMNSHSNPRSFKEAISQSCWQEATNA
jgi:hypothetical protein